MSFSRYLPEDSVVSSEAVVTSAWANNLTSLSTFFTSSYTEYNINVYQSDPAISGSEIQFSLQYAHISGSGSSAINSAASIINSPSRIIYGEYRNLIFGTETTNFNFNNGLGTTSEDFWVINIARSRYKESLFPNSFKLNLQGNINNIVLTTDASISSNTNFIGENIYYNLVDENNLTGTSYGYMFPDLNLLILDCSLIDTFIGLPPNRNSNILTDNALLLLFSISSGGPFILQSQETISSRYFFTRVKNGEFNYTTNPSIIDDNGNIIYSTLINSPQTYITGVGLYNDNNELLAIAKLSKPLLKDFTKEALMRIKLSFSWIIGFISLFSILI